MFSILNINFRKLKKKIFDKKSYKRFSWLERTRKISGWKPIHREVSIFKCLQTISEGYSFKRKKKFNDEENRIIYKKLPVFIYRQSTRKKQKKRFDFKAGGHF